MDHMPIPMQFIAADTNACCYDMIITSCTAPKCMCDATVSFSAILLLVITSRPATVTLHRRKSVDKHVFKGTAMWLCGA